MHYGDHSGRRDDVRPAQSGDRPRRVTVPAGAAAPAHAGAARRSGTAPPSGCCTLLAISAVVAIVLILVFIAKEAAPIFYSKVVREEVTLAKMWMPQLWPGYDEAASIWQPVSEIPKFGVWPLILGTLKVTHRRDGGRRCRSASARRVYVSQYARPRTREIVKPVVELLAGHPVGRARASSR